MPATTLFLITIGLAIASYIYGRSHAFSVARKNGGVRALHSLPTHYGMMVAMWCALPALAIIIGWKLFEPTIVSSLLQDSIPQTVIDAGSKAIELYKNDIGNLVDNHAIADISDPIKQVAAQRLENLHNTSSLALMVLALTAAIAGASLAARKIKPDTRARQIVEKIVHAFLVSCASLAILTTLGIVLSVLFESIRFFQEVGVLEFITGTKWSPQTAIRVDQVGSSGSFGAVPLFLGTLLISFIAMMVAVPLGLMSAIYLAEYASRTVRNIAKPLLEILAGIPTVVYGFFAALTVAPALRSFGATLGLSVSSESALAAGAVMGIMIIPFVSSLSDDVITAVPQSMRDGSYGLGATKSETIRKVVIPAALPGIVGGILLAVSRAIGETMIVVMAAGLAANLTANPLEAVTTVTVQIVTLLTGDQEFDSAKTLAAFALGLMLFVVTLCLNIIALHVVRKYREQYE
ncbi:phosphate ABC transporter permease subunit PstC [Granulosicoccus antarcticus]|uniref:Phosphate transport system permease protein n=1 Tax=Granulosicoccus antarcticus IMCC3135 TaxID=1192854 RepID=A0A2Z2NSG0_9GAMM|nr:phosphate ABC transporter permease subunit PstC [Granulosicoccus antarcticus]ASJ74486.1 Phosphate transport system permease protein PstC 1 [Granulosicoccus antarcticus IMCC3135]